MVTSWPQGGAGSGGPRLAGPSALGLLLRLVGLIGVAPGMAIGALGGPLLPAFAAPVQALLDPISALVHALCGSLRAVFGPGLLPDVIRGACVGSET